MTRVTLLYGEETLLVEYNKRVAEKLNEKSSEKTMRKSSSCVGFIRGIRQMKEDIDTYHAHNTYLKPLIGGFFNTKKDFYRLISLLLIDLGLVFGIRSPSPWQVITELRNRDIITESDSTKFKECLSIANEIRIKTYFANGGQKELFSPLRPIPDTAEQSTEHPILPVLDQDILVRVLITSNDLQKRCSTLYLKYIQEDKVDYSIFRNPISSSVEVMRSDIYTRLQNFDKSLEILESALESIPKDSRKYAQCVSAQGNHHLVKKKWKKATECYEDALQYSKDPYDSLFFYSNLTTCLLQRSQFKKAEAKLEEAMKLHEEIYGKGSETKILSRLMLHRGNLFYVRKDTQSALETFQRAEQIQKRMTCFNDAEVISVNTHIAWAYSDLRQSDRALDYLNRVLCLSHKILGEHSRSWVLVTTYYNAAIVHRKCGRYDDASSMLDRSFKLAESLYGDNAHPGKIVEIEKSGPIAQKDS